MPGVKAQVDCEHGAEGDGGDGESNLAECKLKAREKVKLEKNAILSTESGLKAREKVKLEKNAILSTESELKAREKVKLEKNAILSTESGLCTEDERSDLVLCKSRDCTRAVYDAMLRQAEREEEKAERRKAALREKQAQELRERCLHVSQRLSYLKYLKESKEQAALLERIVRVRPPKPKPVKTTEHDDPKERACLERP